MDRVYTKARRARPHPPQPKPARPSKPKPPGRERKLERSAGPARRSKSAGRAESRRAGQPLRTRPNGASARSRKSVKPRAGQAQPAEPQASMCRGRRVSLCGQSVEQRYEAMRGMLGWVEGAVVQLPPVPPPVVPTERGQTGIARACWAFGWRDRQQGAPRGEARLSPGQLARMQEEHLALLEKAPPPAEAEPSQEKACLDQEGEGSERMAATNLALKQLNQHLQRQLAEQTRRVRFLEQLSANVID